MYVIINGVNSDTIQGLQILSLPPITKPKMRTSVATIDGRPGDIVTYLGYEAYNKTIKILLHDTYDLPAIMAYFNQSGTIIFSNDPDKVYTFETIEQINYERAVKFKTASVTIHVQPYKLSATEEPATGEVETLVDRTPYIIRRTPFGTRQKGTIVGGSIVWNQLVKPSWIASSSFTSYGVDVTVNGDGTVTLNGTVTEKPTNQVMWVYFKSTLGSDFFSVTQGHKYLYLAPKLPDGISGSNMLSGSTATMGYVLRNGSTIVNCLQSGNTYCYGRLDNVPSGTVFNNYKYWMNVFDLTLMFGPTIADYIYTQEQATAGAGVALAKAWAGITADYYPYDEGSIKSIEGLTAHRMTGFNQWDEVWEVGAYSGANGNKVTSNDRIRSKNMIAVVPNTNYYVKAPYNLQLYEYGEGGAFLRQRWSGTSNARILISSDAHYITFNGVANSGTTYNNDICINIYNPAKNKTYEPYDGHVYPLDSSLTLRGLPKLDGDNLYYDGDVYKADGTVEEKWTEITLNGTENWAASSSSENWFYARVDTMIKVSDYSDCVLCDKLNVVPIFSPSGGEYSVSGYYDTNNNYPGQNWIYIRLGAEQNTAAKVKEWLASNPVTVVYKRATSVIIQAEPYTELQICDPNGTEEWVGANMPVGHETTYIDPISMTVNNTGNTTSAPSITIEGEGAVEVTVDGLIAFEINMPTTGAITIDSKAMDATDGDGNLANRSVSGDYTNLQLAPGEHTVVVVGDVSNVTMKNVSRWL